ncbi:MAG: DUF3565 domain-containing protein [Porticoccus sp.]
MKRAIENFHLDRFQEWVADLECGHVVTMRHNPPYQECKWIGTAKGRQAHIGDIQECVNCDMPVLPENLDLLEVSPVYQKGSIPEEFYLGYKTDLGRWAKIVVKKGLLQFVIHSEPAQGFVLDEHLCGVLAPGVCHDIKPAMGDVEFYLEYYQ